MANYYLNLHEERNGIFLHFSGTSTLPSKWSGKFQETSIIVTRPPGSLWQRIPITLTATERHEYQLTVEHRAGNFIVKQHVADWALNFRHIRRNLFWVINIYLKMFLDLIFENKYGFQMYKLLPMPIWVHSIEENRGWFYGALAYSWSQPNWWYKYRTCDFPYPSPYHHFSSRG